MSIDKALSFLKTQIQVQSTSSQVPVTGVHNDRTAFKAANEQALDEVAKYAVSLVRSRLSRPFDGTSSRPGESPKMRTQSLRNSIHWRRARSSREFPGPVPRDMTRQGMAAFRATQPDKYQWYKRINKRAYADNRTIRPYPASEVPNSLTRVIEVDPSATDTSDRGRLEYYSYYLETGWYSRTSKQFLDKGNRHGQKAQVPSAKPAGLKEGSGWNPPRPFLLLLARSNYKADLEQLYQTTLAKLLPSHLKYMASKAKLTVTYNRALRVPYIAENKGLLN